MRDIRLIVFRMIIFGSLVLLALSLGNLQVMNGSHYRHLGEKNRIRLIRMTAPRGSVYDRNGELLAATRPSFDVFIVPEDFDPKNIQLLSRLLGIEQKRIVAKLNHLQDAPFVPVLLERDIPKETLFKIEERKPSLTGVVIEVQGMRSYPKKNMSSHLLGYLGKITREEYQNQEDIIYQPDDWIGRSGIEKIFDRTLKGEDGGRQVEVNVRGRPIRILGEKEALPGKDVRLTIDSRLEEAMMAGLGSNKGAVCLIDIEKGEILGMVSKPDFDPNIFVSPGRSPERMRILMDHKDMPMLNRSVSAGYPPGSVFKLVTALAALEKKRISLSTKFNCKGKFRFTPKGRAFKCWNSDGHGSVNLNSALERSCNVFFYQTGLRVGPRDLAFYARELGLGQNLELEMTNVSEGFIPDTEWKRKKLHDEWYQGETLNFAIGQGFVLTTPLQLARMVGIIGRDGEVSPIHVVQDETRKPTKRFAALNKESVQVLKQAMRRVVQSDHGTGQLARVDFLEMAAKTGTAQVPPKDPHSWFSGFFPFDHPKYALTVFVENGGSGGYKAAPIAKEVILKMKELGFFEGLIHDQPQVSQGKTV